MTHCALALGLLLAGTVAADDLPPSPPGAAERVPAPAATVSLSPAIVMLKSKSGQSWTQSFRVQNLTPMTFQFDVEVADVVTRDGKREVIPAGQIPNGIAAAAVVSPSRLTVGPQQQGAAVATITLPPETPQRAVIVFFRGKTEVSTKNGDVTLGASLGGLVTFTLSDQFHAEATNFVVGAQSETRNLTISQDLKNTGAEPMVPKGSMAIVDESGKRVSKAVFEAQRLLPGERLVFMTASPTQLTPGRYKVVTSFEFEGMLITGGGEVTVP